jgi:hypothetical protein
MYVRYPSNNRGGVKLPENYSGNAFTRQSPYSEMPPPLRTQTTRHDSPHNPNPPELDIPSDELRYDPVPLQYDENEEAKTAYTDNDTKVTPSSSIFSSLLPKGALSSHFPFGHGIGSEELLILAVMLMVFLSGNESGEIDSEFILLLGLLLFAG